MLRLTAIRIEPPTMTAPCPRIRSTAASPSVSARARPIRASDTSISDAEATSRISKIGAPSARNALMWYIGRSGTLESANGIRDGVWQWTMAPTSGRAR